MYRLVPCVPIFRGFFIKSAKRMCICDYVKNRIDTFKNLCFDVKKGYKQISALDSCKTICSLFDSLLILIFKNSVERVEGLAVLERSYLLIY